ncbi:MAG: hypothetical protein AABX53_00665 [Nanoarchaeota archaeon]
MADKQPTAELRKTDPKEIARRVSKEFPGLTRLLAQKVGTELRVREGPQPNTYTFFRKTTEGPQDIGVCSYDDAKGRKVYTGHIPDTILEVQEVCGINPNQTARYETLRVNLGTGSPVTLKYNTKAKDEEGRTVEKREDTFSQIPFP